MEEVAEREEEDEEVGESRDMRESSDRLRSGSVTEDMVSSGTGPGSGKSSGSGCSSDCGGVAAGSCSLEEPLMCCCCCSSSLFPSVVPWCLSRVCGAAVQQRKKAGNLGRYLRLCCCRGLCPCGERPFSTADMLNLR